MECQVPSHQNKEEIWKWLKKKKTLKTSEECMKETKTRNEFLRFKENNNTMQIKKLKENLITRESQKLKDKNKKRKSLKKKLKQISIRKNWHWKNKLLTYNNKLRNLITNQYKREATHSLLRRRLIQEENLYICLEELSQ